MAVAAQYRGSVEESTRSMFAFTVYAQVHDWLWSCLLLDFRLVCNIGIWELFQTLGVRHLDQISESALSPLCSSGSLAWLSKVTGKFGASFFPLFTACLVMRS